jgi:hypothetical protein
MIDVNVMKQQRLERMPSLPQYPVPYFADKHGISQHRAKDILGRAGDSRRLADELAKAER